MGHPVIQIQTGDISFANAGTSCLWAHLLFICVAYGTCQYVVVFRDLNWTYNNSTQWQIPTFYDYLQLAAHPGKTLVKLAAPLLCVRPPHSFPVLYLLQTTAGKISHWKRRRPL